MSVSDFTDFVDNLKSLFDVIPSFYLWIVGGILSLALIRCVVGVVTGG